MPALNSYFTRNLFNVESFSGFIEPVIQLFSPTTRLNSLQSKVTRVSWNNKNTYTLHIAPNKKWLPFKAGQFVQLTVEKDGAYLTRCFSISSSPSMFLQTGEIELTIKAQKHGAITPWLGENLKSGSRIYLSQAQGDFTLQENQRKKLFIAGGSGITPILSMLREHASESWMKETTLLFYVRSASERLFIPQLKKLREQGLNFRFIYTSEDGRFNASQLKEVCPNPQNVDIYVCGPGEMIESVRKTSTKQGTNEENIHSEYFGYQPTHFEPECVNDDIIEVNYASSKKLQRVSAQNKQQTLLEMAEAEGLQPTSGCRIGVCHQCICKKKQGRVYNLKTKQVSDSGEEEIQLCLSVPLDRITLEI